ncbi:hypothetical protein SAMN05421664_2874 [Chryseobacterium soldanellicola]|uniref:Lipoprotein n=1 Tax=Chryseobacterium soldanellicola TaxID=311333 RepID=A0A1H1EBV9_9FLAO|nr:hypothetical protein [Chryseobacterium soldanellicola]SDQ86030.1 hypothetical protein SAMN05421664_2874 [Chryseobacterium soldanellicola]
MKNVIKFTLALFLLAVTSCKKEKTTDDELKEAAAGLNKMTPQILNDGIRLDSVSAGTKMLKYNYTLTEDVKENVTEEEINNFKKEAKEGAINAIKTSADMKDFRDNDVTLKYSYYDKNGKSTADFTVTPSEYKSK